MVDADCDDGYFCERGYQPGAHTCSEMGDPCAAYGDCGVGEFCDDVAKRCRPYAAGSWIKALVTITVLCTCNGCRLNVLRAGKPRCTSAPISPEVEPAWEFAASPATAQARLLDSTTYRMFCGAVPKRSNLKSLRAWRDNVQRAVGPVVRTAALSEPESPEGAAGSSPSVAIRERPPSALSPRS
eukprot:XP_001699820.1 predicted protein [Chlamydomonas reinhardtii]